VSQVHGASGLAIIKAILDGERDKHALLSLCHKSVIKNKAEQVLKALEGFYTPQGLFALGQAYDAYQFYQGQIVACDAELGRVLEQMNVKQQGKIRRKPIRHNKPAVGNLGSHLLKLFGGRDATLLPGLTDYNWLQLFAETGNDLSRWPSEKHFTSWLGLSPGQHHSGRMRKSRRKGRPTAGQVFRQIAQSLLNSKTIAFGAFARRLRGRKGPATAIKATARKVAVQYWRLMMKGAEFVEKGVATYEETLKKQKQKFLAKLAEEFQVEIVPIT
jgi:transposase